MAGSSGRISSLCSTVESWRHSEELHRLDLADGDPRNRVSDEAPWYFGNTYGRAWWNTRRDESEHSEDLRRVIDEAINKTPNYTEDVQMQLVEEILRLSKDP